MASLRIISTRSCNFHVVLRGGKNFRTCINVSKLNKSMSQDFNVILRNLSSSIALANKGVPKGFEKFDRNKKSKPAQEASAAREQEKPPERPNANQGPSSQKKPGFQMDFEFKFPKKGKLKSNQINDAISICVTSS